MNEDTPKDAPDEQEGTESTGGDAEPSQDDSETQEAAEGAAKGAAEGAQEGSQS